MPKKAFLPYHTPRRSLVPWGLIFIPLLALFIWGCAAGHYEFYDNLKNFMTRGEYQQADKTVQQNQARVYGDKDLLLYYFDRGWLLHLAGRWNESNRMFALAEQLSDDYFTKSISTEASTFLISDNMRPYYGEDFERAMIHVFSALNYLYLNKYEDALVEARRVDLFLTKLQTDYGYQNYYNDDAFIRYLMGLIYETQGEINDAFISYRKALELYKSTEKVYGVKIPPDLVFSALQAAADMGFTREFGEIKDDFPELGKDFVPVKRKFADTGEIIFLHYNGRVPHKADNIFKFAFGQAWGYVGMVEVDGKAREDVYNAATVIESIASEEQVNVAFPKFVPTRYEILLSTLEIGGRKYQTDLVDDIGQIAVKNLQDRQGRVFVKSVARAALKFALTKVAEKKIETQTRNEVAQWLLKSAVKTTAALTEKADKRSWQTLPDQIRMSRISLPQGIYSLNISFVDRRGYVAQERKLDNIKVLRGRKTFVYVSSVD